MSHDLIENQLLEFQAFLPSSSAPWGRVTSSSSTSGDLVPGFEGLTDAHLLFICNICHKYIHHYILCEAEQV